MSNRSMPELYKIGKTTLDPRTRLDRANSSGDEFAPPLPYKLEFAKFVDDVGGKEKTIHKSLAPERVNPNREFFKRNLEQIRAIFELIEGEWWLEGRDFSNPATPRESSPENIQEPVASALGSIGTSTDGSACAANGNPRISPTQEQDDSDSDSEEVELPLREGNSQHLRFSPTLQQSHRMEQARREANTPSPSVRVHFTKPPDDDCVSNTSSVSRNKRKKERDYFKDGQRIKNIIGDHALIGVYDASSEKFSVKNANGSTDLLGIHDFVHHHDRLRGAKLKSGNNWRRCLAEVDSKWISANDLPLLSGSPRFTAIDEYRALAGRSAEF